MTRIHHLLIGLWLSIMTVTSSAQDFAVLQKIELKTSEDYIRNNKKVLESADYVMTGAIDENALNKLYCTQFIFRWMEGSPYTFALGDDFVQLPGDDNMLRGVYLAALVKAAITSTENTVTPEMITERGRGYFLDYAADPNHKVKANKYIKKALKERKG